MAYTHAHAHAHDDTLSSLYAHQRIRRASMRHAMSNGQDIKLTPLTTNSPKTARVYDSERSVNTQDLVGNCHNPEAGCWHYKNEKFEHGESSSGKYLFVSAYVFFMFAC